MTTTPLPERKEAPADFRGEGGRGLVEEGVKGMWEKVFWNFDFYLEVGGCL